MNKIYMCNVLWRHVCIINYSSALCVMFGLMYAECVSIICVNIYMVNVLQLLRNHGGGLVGNSGNLKHK